MPAPSAPRAAAALLRRDLARALAGHGGGALLPVLFFLAVAMLFPFAVGPDPRLLARAGGGVIWVAALLAAILPVDRLIAPDVEAGFVDQWSVRGLSAELVAAIRMVAHWLAFAPALMLAALPAAALLGLPAAALARVELGLAVGTPGLAALAVLIAAVTAGLGGGAALGGLLLLPLAIPILIFGAGALIPGNESGLPLAAAASLLAIAITPFAAAAAMRAGR